MKIPSGTGLFIDTNILLYAISEHPLFGGWADELLDRVRAADIRGVVSVIVLNELMHKLVVAEVAERENLKPNQVTMYIKGHPEVLGQLRAYDILEEVERNYNLRIVEIDQDLFSASRVLMTRCLLLSNDALHLAVMNRERILDVATNDSDFDDIKGIQVWKPEKAS